MEKIVVIAYKDYGKHFSFLPAPGEIPGFEPVLVLFLRNKADVNLELLSSENFEKNVENYKYIYYDPKKRICCMSGECIPELTEPNFQHGFPGNTVFWCSIPIAEFEKAKELVNFDFRDPYLSTFSITKKEIPKSICMIKSSRKGCFALDRESIKNKIEHFFKMEDEDTCLITLQLSKSAISFLKSAPKSGYENGEQKELTGELQISKVDSKGVFHIDMKKETVKTGEKETVVVENTRYNFHSHPEQAYIKYSVKKAWPSVSDFLGYRQLGKATICHFVACLEGIYILSLGQFWGKNISKVPKKFISKNYKIDHKEDLSPKQYTEKVNSILYKGENIFKVEFFSWEKADTCFSVAFSQIKNSCLITADNMKNNSFFFS